MSPKTSFVERTLGVIAAAAMVASPAFAQFSPQGHELRVRSYQALVESVTGAAPSGEWDKCGLPILSAVIRQRSLRTPLQQAALSVLTTRPEFQTSIVSGGFRFHFDTTGADAPALLDSSGQRISGSARAFVDSAAAIMAYVSDFETSPEGLAFDAPPTDGLLGGGPEYDIYIHAIPEYGLTSLDNDVPDGGRSSSFIEIHNDFSFVYPPKNRGMRALRVTLAHEYHHAIQIGAYGFWPGDIWYHEITSVWMEDEAFRGINDYVNYLFSTQSEFRHPEQALTTNDNIMYSRGIFGKYLSKRFGKDAVRHTWEAIRTAPPLAAIDNALKRPEYASDMRVAYAEWALWNYYTGYRADTAKYYTEGQLFPVMSESIVELAGAERTVSNDLACLGTRYYRFLTSAVDSVAIILSNLSTSCSGQGNLSPFSFSVSRTKTTSSYKPIAGDLFLRLDVADPSQWMTWDIGASGPGGTAVAEGSAYPNPFRPDDQQLVYLPANAADGTLSIFSSNMELVYSAAVQTTVRLGQRVVTWDGRTTSGGAARSGIYVYVLDLHDRTVTGKIAVVRR